MSQFILQDDNEQCIGSPNLTMSCFCGCAVVRAGTKHDKPDQTLRQILPPTQNLGESSEALIVILLLHVCLETFSHCQELGYFFCSHAVRPEEANKLNLRRSFTKPHLKNCQPISLKHGVILELKHCVCNTWREGTRWRKSTHYAATTKKVSEYIILRVLH